MSRISDVVNNWCMCPAGTSTGFTRTDLVCCSPVLPRDFDAELGCLCTGFSLYCLWASPPVGAGDSSKNASQPWPEYRFVLEVPSRYVRVVSLGDRALIVVRSLTFSSPDRLWRSISEICFMVYRPPQLIDRALIRLLSSAALRLVLEPETFKPASHQMLVSKHSAVAP